jgi:hypothetical protein
MAGGWVWNLANARGGSVDFFAGPSARAELAAVLAQRPLLELCAPGGRGGSSRMAGGRGEPIKQNAKQNELSCYRGLPSASTQCSVLSTGQHPPTDTLPFFCSELRGHVKSCVHSAPHLSSTQDALAQRLLCVQLPVALKPHTRHIRVPRLVPLVVQVGSSDSG